MKYFNYKTPSFNDKYSLVMANKENGMVKISPTPKNNNPKKLIAKIRIENCKRISMRLSVNAKLLFNDWKAPWPSSTIKY